MKYLRLFENFDSYDPYELMIMFPNKKAEMIGWFSCAGGIVVTAFYTVHIAYCLDYIFEAVWLSWGPTPGAYFNENVVNTKDYKANTFVQLTSVATKTFSWTGSPGGNFAVTDFSGVPSNAKALAVYGWYHIRGYGVASGQGDHAVSWFGLTNGQGPISWSDPNGGYPGGSDTFTPQYYGSFVMEHDGDASIQTSQAGMHYYGSWHQGIINVNANGNIYYTLGYGYSGGTHYNALYCTGYWI
jgi:hypothetical protein